MFRKKKKPQSTAIKEAQQANSETESIDSPFSEQELRILFKEAGDIFFNSSVYRLQSPLKITFIGCQGMVDFDLLNQLVVERLNLFFDKHPTGDLSQKEIAQFLHLPQLKEVKTKQTLFADIYCGKLLIFFHDYKYLFSTNIAHRPQRTPEETATELTVKGPRDNFIEDISVNVALIRKRLRTNSLHVKNFEVGKRSLTKVALLYMTDVANPVMIKELSKKISKINVDGIYSGNQFMELIEKASPIMPRHHYTGRPDFAVHSLLTGRIILIIDGISYSIITPVNAFFLLKTAEDAEYTSAFSSFERALRIVGIFAATLLPGFFVAVTTYHPDQIPLILLSTIVESRRGIPFPTALEAIIMLLLFELFKEAGLRMPSAAGGTLSVLGALIIGDAAIRSGLTSPAMLVVIAGSSIATFTLVNQSLIGAISLIRISCIILSSFLGLFGFLFMVHFVMIYISNIRVLGMPFFGLTGNLNLKYILKTLFRIPSRLDTTRGQAFFSKDPTKKGNGGQS